jgi:hypothetical protein
MTTTKLEYLNHLQNLRNDFYNRGNNEAATKVQDDINNLMKS